MSKKEIMSPLPGTFYRKPSPDSDNFKNDGDAVEVDDVVGLAEVMKSFHEIKSTVSGVSVKFLIQDGDAVMPGQVIAEVK